MKEQKEIFIYCPVCGCQYLPSEIYLPDYFLGKAKNIDKDHITGKILYHEGKYQDLQETYICDVCNNQFKITAKLQFATKLDNKTNFDKPHVTTINQLFLEET